MSNKAHRMSQVANANIAPDKVTASTKFYYGLGFSSRGIKDGLFQIFVFFYFSQVLGLDPGLAGLASLISLIFDAVSDPVVGVISDGWKSEKWGRRHPFLFASAVPLGVLTWLLFIPPADLGQSGLFLWYLSFTILIRLALTVFVVPFSSLGAELSTDYHERTTITAVRIMFASVVSPIIMIIGYLFFFKKTDDIEHGLFNLAAYPKFAMFCGALMIFFILISAWKTRHVIPTLPKQSDKQKSMSFWDMMGGVRQAVKMKSFTSLVLSLISVYISIGIGMVLSTYFGTYYFEFTSEQMALLPIGAGIGGLLSMVLAPMMGKVFDKKKGLVISTIVFASFFSLPFNLGLLGLFPQNGDPLLLPLYVVTLIIAYSFLWVTFSLCNSMMAEVVDEYELQSGIRQEGLFFAFMSFAFKCSTGLGQFFAGIIIGLIAFPTKADISDVPQKAIDNLGIVGGPVLLTVYLLSLVFIVAYPITKSRYEEIRAALDANVVSEN